MTEQSILAKQKIDSLTHILFNIGFRGRPETIETISCYNPRNAIIFIDAKGQPFEFIEICFECKKVRLSSSQIPTGEFCTQKYDLLKNFFFRCGVKIGTAKGTEWWKQ